jgi:C_GCAxxG_C_C family probable redox protein
VSSRRDEAAKKILSGFNCAQSVFYVFSDYLDFDKNIAVKIASGFGAGMGRKEEVCGAVSGGILVLGTKYGRGENDDRSSTEITYAKTRELIDRFVARHGTIICRKLIDGCELTTEEGQRQFKQNDLLNKRCKLCVESVVEILNEMLQL